MNFIKLSFKIRIFFFTILILGVCMPGIPVSYQDIEREPIKSIFPIPNILFQGEILNYQFDNVGTLFICSGSKIGIYNGAKWKFFNLKNQSIITESNSGAVFFASSSTVYSLKVDSSLQYSFVELFQLENENEIINQLFSYGSRMLINTGKSIYSWEEGVFEKLLQAKKETEIIVTGSKVIFKSDGKYFQYEKKNGSYEATGDFQIILDHPKGFITYSQDEDCIKVLSEEFSFIEKYGFHFGKIRDMIRINDSLYALINNGQNLIVFNESGEEVFNMKTGELTRNTKLELSPCGRLWINTISGFEVFDIQSDILKLKIPDVIGNILWIEKHKEALFLATTKGLFSVDGEQKIFNSACQYIATGDDYLFGCSDEEVFMYSEKSGAEIILENCSNIGWDDFTERLFAIQDMQLISLSFDENNHIESAQYPEYGNVQNFAVWRGNLLLLKHDTLIYIDPSRTQQDTIELPNNYRGSDILRIQFTKGTFFLYTSQEVFKYTRFQDGINAKYQISPLKEEWDGSVLIYNIDEFLEEEEELFDFFPMTFYDNKAAGIFILKNKKVLISRDNELFMFEKSSRDSAKNISVHINELSINQKQVFYSTDFQRAIVFMRKTLNSIPYRKNQIIIKFSCSDYIYPDCQFQYKLTNKNETINSDWLNGNQLELSDLMPGDYELELKLRNSTLMESLPAKLKFHINTPFYSKWYAVLIYFFLSGFIFFILYRLRMIKKHSIKEIEDDTLQVEAYHKATPETTETREKPNLILMLMLLRRKANGINIRWLQFYSAIFRDLQRLLNL